MPTDEFNSVLPPPPRYPINGPYGTGLGGVVPMIETNNTIAHPDGPEWEFLVGEGTYVLKEDLHLATPPPHPSEAPVVNPNPLSTTPQPETRGARVTLLSLDAKAPPPFFYKGQSTTSLSLNGAQSSSLEQTTDTRFSVERGMSSEDGRGTSTSDAPATSMTMGSAPAFGEGNTLLTQVATGKDANKRKKPKNNMTKSNSSFISRVIANESLSKKLVDRRTDGMFAFANINRAFQWLDLSSSTKQDYLTKILFTKAHCLCHDVNLVTKSQSHLDVVMGFSTGEIIWWEPISQRYTRLNKHGIINGTPASEIKWIPGSENLFLTAHMDGSLVVYDKEKEDAEFIAEEEDAIPNGSEAGDAPNGIPHRHRIQVHKSVHSKNQKANPVAVWKLSNHRINAFAFSPDNRHLAVVSEDGTLRIIDYLKEELLALYNSYYGGMSCVCWSPDGKYVLSGGQDDLISIWSMADSALVARCYGHQSWVSAVAFDPWRCDDRNYRFGSVGEDGRLCLWDFNAAMLHRTRPQLGRPRGSASQLADMSGNGKPEEGQRMGGDDAQGIFHPVEPRANIPMLPPVLNKNIDTHPACWLEFTEDAIITSCKNGHIRTWYRPGAEIPEHVQKKAEESKAAAT